MRKDDARPRKLQAEALIVERGPQGFSLREVARRARVSEAAPYWHFANKEALLAAIAEAGFVALAAALEAVRDRIKEPGRRLRELGIAYVRFALAHPVHLRLMFGPEIADEGVPFRDIAGVIGRRLNVPVVSKTPEKAIKHFGWFAPFAAIDCPASSAQTQERLGWQPKQPGLIPDLDRPRYFQA
jgi:AcrR family transcriptional regulator